MVYTVDINLQGVYSSILIVNFHSKMQKNRACVSTGAFAPSARFSNHDWTEKPQRSRPNNFFLISYAGLTSVGTLLKIARKEVLSIEISIFFEVVEM